MNKLQRKIVLFIGIVFSLLLLTYIYDNLNEKAKLNNVEGFNIRQRFNSTKRKLNKMKNKFWYEGKNQIRKMFYKK